jgi:S1-C subfamily serine protease
MTYRVLAALVAFVAVVIFVMATKPTSVVGNTKPKAGPVVKVSFAGGHGSGVHIGHGFILTAAHVVGAGRDLDVKTDDRVVIADVEVLWANTKYDVALIRVDPSSPLRKRDLSCAAPEIGDKITASGNPLDMEFVTHYGRVGSGLQPVYWPPFSGMVQWPVSYALDAGLVPGMSGGPVIDSRGDVVGIIVGRAPGESLFFAVPGSVACELMGRA